MRSRRSFRFVVATVLAAAVVAAGATAASAGGPPSIGLASILQRDYLALGDSVAFGYVPPGAVPPPNYQDADSFVGYPEDLARLLFEHVSNASCPGETTASFLDVNAISNGCESSPTSPIGYRDVYPLHVQYSGSQMDYALSYLASHPSTRLVTIDIGANDAFVCQETTADHCTSQAELAAVAQQVSTNLAKILGQIRGTYSGPLVVLTYYSLSYADQAQVQSTQFLNSVITQAAAPFGVIVADGYRAFQIASLGARGDSCAAGLLIKLPDGTCDVHPSPKGQLVLALAIESALVRANALR